MWCAGSFWLFCLCRLGFVVSTLLLIIIRAGVSNAFRDLYHKYGEHDHDCGDSATIMCIMLALTMISRLIPVRGLSLTLSMLKITKDVAGFPARDPG